MTFFDVELLEVMPDSVTVHAYTGKDTFGNETYGVGLPGVRVNWEPRRSRGINSGKDATQGNKPRIDGKLYAQPGMMNPKDKVILPNGDIAYVTEVTDWRNVPEAGNHHQEATYVKEQ